MGIKRDATDKWFSDCVRERANWTCEHSGLVDNEAQATGKSRTMECATFTGEEAVMFDGIP